MATAKPTSPSGKGTGTKASGKTAATRATSSTATKRTSKAKTTAPKAAKARVTVSDSPTAVFGDYAERAVLIPVGAALIARERVMDSVSSTLLSYSSSSKAQAQLRRFERRGTTARKRLEREVRKARVRFERELRHRRREVEKTFGELEARRDAVAKNGTDFANRVPELANRVPELANRVPELATRVPELANRVPELANRVPEIATQVQERILSLV
jgi:methyl-accepting chemotaxis protein